MGRRGGRRAAWFTGKTMSRHGCRSWRGVEERRWHHSPWRGVCTYSKKSMLHSFNIWMADERLVLLLEEYDTKAMTGLGDAIRMINDRLTIRMVEGWTGELIICRRNTV